VVSERNILDIFVAIFVPVPLPFPPLCPVVASFRSLVVSAIQTESHERKEQSRYTNDYKRADSDNPIHLMVVATSVGTLRGIGANKYYVGY
jgi:hypothetical protein